MDDHSVRRETNTFTVSLNSSPFHSKNPRSDADRGDVLVCSSQQQQQATRSWPEHGNFSQEGKPPVSPSVIRLHQITCRCCRGSGRGDRLNLPLHSSGVVHGRSGSYKKLFFSTLFIPAPLCLVSHLPCLIANGLRLLFNATLAG